MGNGSSVDALASNRVKEELADLHRSLQALSVRCRPPPVLLPSQVVVDNVVVDTQQDVHVLLGPVIGKVEFQRARILLEVNRKAVVTMHVSTLDGVSSSMVEIPQHSLSVHCKANTPVVFVLERLVPGKKYTVTFGGIRSQDVPSKRGTFTTQSLENGNKLNVVAVSGDNFYELESGEKSMWGNVKQRVQNDQVQMVLHLGGQVTMERMFDRAVQLLLLYADGLSSSGVEKVDWPTMEARATEVLRSAYRSQWTLSPDLQFVLANASNLMMWSDADIYPQFSTRQEFFIDHEQPTLRMQVIRTATRCARRLFHQYQRQLWDDDMKQVIGRETELIAVAEKALAATGEIFTLSMQIPKTAEDLELQKKRHDIEGARRVDKLLRAQEAEKARLEKQLVSFNQLLAPQRGEELILEVGRVTILFLDLRSSRLELGGSQARDNELLSNMQWKFIEETLERPDIQILLVCSEAPLVEGSTEAGNTETTTTTTKVAETPWTMYGASQARLLSQLFDWKLRQPNRQFVVLSGASNARYFSRTCIKDTKLRTEAEEYIIGAISAKGHFLTKPTRSGVLHDRFEFDRKEDINGENCFITLQLESAQSNTIQVCRVGKDQSDNPVHVLLGPVVGWVDERCAVILLEVDRDAEIPCMIENPFTREKRRLFQRFYANQANSFFVTHLRSGHYYQVSFERIHQPDQFQASFTTAAVSGSRFDVVAMCNESKPLFVPGSLGENINEPSLWHAIAEQTVKAPFVGLNLTIHLGGQFFPESNGHVHEALLCAGTSVSSNDKWEEDPLVTAAIVSKFREMYRSNWNLPGIQESLAHGAHLMLTNENDHLLENNQDGEDQQNVSVRELLAKFHVGYQNLLLPPSKRLRKGEARGQKPLCHCFGAFGLFILPVEDVEGSVVHESTWLALQKFLATPTLSRLLLISTEILIDEALEDIREKAKFNASYRRKFGFYHQDMAQLLSILFRWQQTESEEISLQGRKQVVLLSGSGSRSLSTVIREVFPCPVTENSISIFQCGVGPLRVSELPPFYPSTILEQGSLFGKYTYQHSFLQLVLSTPDEELSLTAPDDTKKTGKKGSLPTTNQLVHLRLENDDDNKETTESALGSVDVCGKCNFVSYDMVEIDSPLNGRVSCCRVGSTWQLATVLPAWLHEILAQPTTEDEEEKMKELTTRLQDKKSGIEVVFKQSPLFANDLVDVADVRQCAAALTESILMLHQLGGSAFCDDFLQAPLEFIITFTIQQLQKADRFPNVGTANFEQFAHVCQQSLVNAWLFSDRLDKFWS